MLCKFWIDDAVKCMRERERDVVYPGVDLVQLLWVDVIGVTGVVGSVYCVAWDELETSSIND